MVIRPLAHVSDGLPIREDMFPGRERQPSRTDRDAERPTLAAIRTRDFENLLTALRLLTSSVEMLARKIESLEAKTPGAPDVLSAAEVALIYRGALNRTKLYELSSPSRPGGAVFSRVVRRGGGTGFLRVEIERWLRGLPTESTKKVAGRPGDQPKGADAIDSTSNLGPVPPRVKGWAPTPKETRP